jgi:CMP-N,N'-diacetyllegionaminic acid synthase
LKKIGLIPARKGSKGIKNKNITKINGKPLISYTIEAAINTNIFDQIIVSSNDKNVKDICQNYSVLFQKRPENLCKDTSSPNEVVSHLLNKHSLVDNDIIFYLQPTSPLRNSQHILEADTIFNNYNQPVVSVSASKELPYKMFEIDKENNLRPIFTEETTNMRRQDLPNAFIANGAIYIFSIEQFKRNNRFPSLNGKPYIMKSSESYDIDSIEDKIRVENLMNGKNYGI